MKRSVFQGHAIIVPLDLLNYTSALISRPYLRETTMQIESLLIVSPCSALEIGPPRYLCSMDLRDSQIARQKYTFFRMKGSYVQI